MKLGSVFLTASMAKMALTVMSGIEVSTFALATAKPAKAQVNPEKVINECMAS